MQMESLAIHIVSRTILSNPGIILGKIVANISWKLM
jgi:hypothetical protein